METESRLLKTEMAELRTRMKVEAANKIREVEFLKQQHEHELQQIQKRFDEHLCMEEKETIEEPSS